MSIGPVPVEEACEQLGPNYDPQRARAECEIFRRQLRRQLGEEPVGARLVITSNPHDFGVYFEVDCRFDETNEVATAYAFRCEAEMPAEWDEEASREIKALYEASVT